ncbi:MAG: hypothetical protein HN945_01735 [Deltaproteobacteria bacterium]|jgi:hypothetical protein|nr:hypothetical protein [Deltaproteobacteria bacterium]MBT6615857.1 hypothetical protein [Deltaproteobacteria bacterium]MBT7151158.1 hypothetical protein [Deltaproteobacteria bacterium]
MILSQKLEHLRKHNPFISSSVGDPWNQRFSDVTDIYHKEFHTIQDLIAHKQTYPSESFAAIVTGEAGSGKTHFIGRILDTSHGDPNISFAYIQPIENPQQPYRYLLREIVTNLSRKIYAENRFSQLDRLLGILLKKLLSQISTKKNKALRLDMIRKLEIDPFYAFDPGFRKFHKRKTVTKLGTESLLAFDSHFNPHFLNTLFSYQFSQNKELPLKWLKGFDLDLEALQFLNMEGAGSRSTEALEQEARDILRSLGLLFAFTGHTLILCFDRMENMVSPKQLTAFGSVIEFFVDVAQSILPVAFFRISQWEQKVRNSLNQQVISRLETNMVDLQGCTSQQSIEIIRSRLQTVFQGEESDVFGLIEKSGLFERFNRRRFPREVIIETNREFQKILYPDIPQENISVNDEILQQYSQEVKKIEREFDSYGPDRDRLKRALNIYLSEFPADSKITLTQLNDGTKTGACFDKTDAPYLDLLVEVKVKGTKPFKALFMIDQSENYQTVAAFLKRGLRFLINEPGCKAFYIRDKRSEFKGKKQWRSTHMLLDEFKKRGGRVLALSKREAAGWYALTILNYRLGDHDITVMNEQQQFREVTQPEFMTFVRDTLHRDEFSWFSRIDKYLKTPRATTGKK